MPEIFLILLAGGVMLAAAISDPRAVDLRWLRLAGIIALAMAGLSAYFAPHRAAVLATAIVILAQLAFVQVAWRNTQRVLCAIAFAIAVLSATLLVREIKPMNMTLLAAACSLASATVGLALMDMLLGHAYLNAAQMTMAPFLRLNRSLAAVMVVRAVLSIAGVFVIQSIRPIEMFWNLYGLYVGTRWLVGFVVAGVFVWMAHDCINRRATQSATGILYVAGVLIFIGEIIGLYLMSQTGIPL